MKDIGDRMKNNYENRHRLYLTRRIPVIIRVDGRAFHSYTKNMNRPFDDTFINSMISSAKAVAEDMHGFKIAYVQSDEVSFLITDFDDLLTEAWFDYNKSKIETISASLMTAWFNKFMNTGKLAAFDARSFSIPVSEVANYFVWRSKDWERNSLAMYCGSFFSHKSLMNKNNKDRHDMLHAIGKNWNDLNDTYKNGTFIIKDCGNIITRNNVLPRYDAISKVVEPYLFTRETVNG